MRFSHTEHGYGISVTTPPSGEPVSVADVHAQSRISSTAEDAYLSLLITAARQMMEHDYGLSLMTTTWTMTLDRFPDWHRRLRGQAIELPRYPVQSITSISYVDIASGQAVTLDPSTYTLSKKNRAYVVPSYLRIWPPARYVPDSVQIVFTAGYGDATAVPETAKLALKMLVAHWYENREPVVTGMMATSLPMGLEQLLLNTWDGGY